MRACASERSRAGRQAGKTFARRRRLFFTSDRCGRAARRRGKREANGFAKTDMCRCDRRRNGSKIIDAAESRGEDQRRMAMRRAKRAIRLFAWGRRFVLRRIGRRIRRHRMMAVRHRRRLRHRAGERIDRFARTKCDGDDLQEQRKQRNARENMAGAISRPFASLQDPTSARIAHAIHPRATLVDFATAGKSGQTARLPQRAAVTSASAGTLWLTYRRVDLSSALSDQVESPDRKEFAPIQKRGACPCRKSGSTFPGHALARQTKSVAISRGI
jgi:hypothetical protein